MRDVIRSVPMAVRWICLSDTHFGAENSLLSLVKRSNATVDPDHPSPVLVAMVECLRAVVKLDRDSTRPFLVLNGDILDLALSEDNIAAMVFDRFVDLVFDPEFPLFQPTIFYLPGNHDHHIWETARERMYAEYVASTNPNDDLAAPYHATQLFLGRSTYHLEAELLTALVQRRRGQNLNVRIAYPNMGLENQDSSRQVVIHHGHFTEPLYRLMTLARQVLFPGQEPREEVWDWEADNFAWIDFFWSTLGRSGSVGQDVGLVYDMLQDDLALRRLAEELGNFLGDRGPRLTRPETRLLGREVASGIVDLVGMRERNCPEVVLSDAGHKGLTSYLSGPLAKQLAQANMDREVEELAFIFGHTHKPFESTASITELPKRLSIYNSGGWVIDTETSQPVQGAAVLIIDDDCNVASIRMYNQSDNVSDYRVDLSVPPDVPPNVLFTQLSTTLHFDQPPWTDFSRAAAEEVALRRELLPQIISRGLKSTDREEQGRLASDPGTQSPGNFVDDDQSDSGAGSRFNGSSEPPPGASSHLRVKVFTDRFDWMGPAVVLLSAWYFAAQVLVAWTFKTSNNLSYNFFNNAISDLGATGCDSSSNYNFCSPRWPIMDVSIGILGAAMFLGAMLIFTEFRQSRDRREQIAAAVGFVLLSLSGLGALLVACVPENLSSSEGGLHGWGTLITIGCGQLGILILGFALRSIPDWLREFMIIASLFVLLGGIAYHFKASNAFGFGGGALERLIQYPQTIWLLLFGFYISRDHWRKGVTGPGFRFTDQSRRPKGGEFIRAVKSRESCY
jgi:hypothetical membrane protein